MRVKKLCGKIFGETKGGVTPKMKLILCDWLLEVAGLKSFKLRKETKFLAVLLLNVCIEKISLIRKLRM